MSFVGAGCGSPKQPPSHRNPHAPEDSLRTTSAHTGTPNTTGQTANTTRAQPKTRIAVVLGSSPHRPAFHDPEEAKDELGQDHVASDLSPQPKKKPRVAKETPVPLPVLPGMSRWTAATGTAQAARRQPVPARQTPVPLPQRPTVKPEAPGTSTPRTGRGRPKGWRPGMSYAQMRGNALPGTMAAANRASRPGRPKPGQMGLVKRRGRPPKQPSPPPRELYRNLNPQFVAFLCEWKGCKAELHNLETLRRHVGMIHIEEQEQEQEQEVGEEEEEEEEEEAWHCQWAKCGSREPLPKFSSDVELKAHVEEAHLVPFSWHVGDGPCNSSGRETGKREEDGIPSYLEDTNGNQVTPSIRHQEVEDHMTWRNNRRKLKQLLLERDRNLPSEESDNPDQDEELLPWF